MGLDTLSEFFTRLHLETQVGCSPSALRGVMHAVETALLETAQVWEQDACAGAEVREIIGAVDETFLEQMMLVLMDLRTGCAAGRRGRGPHLYDMEGRGGDAADGARHHGAVPGQ